jgi:hypothetical protein
VTVSISDNQNIFYLKVKGNLEEKIRPGFSPRGRVTCHPHTVTSHPYVVTRRGSAQSPLRVTHIHYVQFFHSLYFLM